MTQAAAPPSRAFARLTGLIYLILAFLGGFAFFAVSEQLFVPGNTAATSANIAAQEGLFRLGVGAYWAILVIDIVLAWMLYRLFQPRNDALARLAAWLRLGYVFTHGAAIMELNGVLDMLNGAFSSQADGLRAELIQHHMAGHLDGFLVSLIVFGVHLLVLGGLIIASRMLPRLIGVLVAIAGAAYIVDGFAFLLLQDYAAFHAATQTVIAVFAVIGEMSMVLWLLIRGVDHGATQRSVAP